MITTLDRRLVLPGEERWVPKSLLGASIVKALPHLPGDLAAEIVDRMRSVVVAESELRIKVFRRLGLYTAGLVPWAEVDVEDYGVVCRKLVTNNGVAYVIDAFQNTTELEVMEFHGIGTGGTAEAQTDAALVTELTTEYNPDGTRATGTNEEGASANIYKTVATNTLDSGTPGIVEHGLFSAASAGVLFDRSVFSVVNLDGTQGDGIQTDYRWTLNAGG